MKILISIVVLIIAALATLKIAAAIIGPGAELGSDTKGLSPCKGAPNCVGSLSDGEFNVKALPFFPTKIWVKWVEEMGGTVEIETGRYLHATFSSQYMGFVDDFELWIPDNLGVTHVRSASRIGYSDLGVNRARVEQLRSYAND